MGISHTIKTDDDAVYTSKSFQSFCKEWQTKHVTDIPYNLQIQGIVEHTHRIFKFNY